MHTTASSRTLVQRQRTAAAHLRELAERLGPRVGLDRRQFLRSSCGMAAAFLSLNAGHGRFFAVDPAEAADPDADAERRPDGARDFIVDAQTRHARSGFDREALLLALALARGDGAQRPPWHPALAGRPVSASALGLDDYVGAIFADSDTTVAVLGGLGAQDEQLDPLTSDESARSRDLVNRLAGAQRVLAQGIIRPGRAGDLAEMERLARTLRVEGWACSTVADPLADAPRGWQMDDDKVAYPAWERALKLRIRTVTVHKGLGSSRFAGVDDVGRAARDFPQLNFVIAHAALRSPRETAGALEAFRTSGRIPWVTDLAEIPLKYGVRNVYAGLGTAFAATVFAAPELTAAILGQLVKGMGPDHVLWATDAIWYGSPRWQIEAFRRFEIPEAMQRQHGFVPLEAGRGRVKRQILGENAAWLYRLRARPLRPAIPADFRDRLDTLRRETR
jgi:predicted TIM-barrel fold metal-dependent hydrolase